MKIILTCDPEIPVPPTLYGGIERIVDGLARAYSELGHEVYLVAHSQSTCQYVKKIYGWPNSHSRGMKNVLKNAMFLREVTQKTKPDLIHSFSRLLYLYPSFYQRKIRILQSYQREISPNSTRMASMILGPKLSFTACASHMIKNLPNKNKFKSVFNFTDTDYFNIDFDRSREYLVFLGRIEEIKGTSEAIHAAISTNQKLIIAGNIQEGHDSYFQEKILPYLSHPLIEYIGTVNDEQKKALLQGAKALLFPIKWEEPFGIVMAEALSCGTPVIGFNRGSVPEVIIHGKNGFIVQDTEELASMISKINSLSLEDIREDAITRFSLRKVAKNYLRI
jgi:glycosyltransferase involved in cell wall biosynthesis